MFWSLLGAAVALIINIALSAAFSGFAENKGYERGKYFWICFFFGTLGYVWVAGLPDVHLQYKIENLERELRNAGIIASTSHSQSTAYKPAAPAYQAPVSSHQATVFQDGSWMCKCGRKNPPYVTSCVCGTNKRDI